jgi:hypothetical protein
MKEPQPFFMDTHISIVKEEYAGWWVFKVSDLMGGVGLASGEADEGR